MRSRVIDAEGAKFGPDALEDRSGPQAVGATSLQEVFDALDGFWHNRQQAEIARLNREFVGRVLTDILPVDLQRDGLEAEKPEHIVAARRSAVILGRDPGNLSGRAMTWTMTFPVGEKRDDQSGRTSVLCAELTGYPNALTMYRVNVPTSLWEVVRPFGPRDGKRNGMDPKLALDEERQRYRLTPEDRGISTIELVAPGDSHADPRSLATKWGAWRNETVYADGLISNPPMTSEVWGPQGYDVMGHLSAVAGVFGKEAEFGQLAERHSVMVSAQA